MERYIEINFEKFIKDSKGWEAEKKEWQTKLESLSELPARKGGEGRTNKPSSAVESMAVSRDMIQLEIERLDYYRKIFDYAWLRLTDTEKELLTGFYFGKSKSIGNFVYDFIDHHPDTGNVNYVYTAKRKAVEAFGEIITERFLI